MRFLAKFYLGLLLLASGGLSLLFGLTDYASLAQRVGKPIFVLGDAGEPLVLTPGRYAALRLALGATLLLTVGLLGLLGLLGLVRRAVRGRSRAAGWGREVRRAGAALGGSWRQLAGAQRVVVLGLFGVVAAARLYYAFGWPLVLDELASYDYSVLPGPALTASYYPFPNNHVAANLLAGLVHGLVPAAPAELALRLLPTLAGLLALPLVFLLLLRSARLEVVALGLGLFWLSPMPVFYAVAGRGYAWTMLAAWVGLAATLELLRPAGRRPTSHRLAWAVFGSSAVLGFYAVPTHVYTVVGLGLGLLIGFGRQRGRQRLIRLAHLVAVSLGIGVVAVVLYAPVGAVSGWGALLANRYVAHSAWPQYSRSIGPFLLTTAQELLGQRGWSAAAWLATALAVPVVLARAQRLSAATRRLGWLLYVQLTLWLPLAVVQGVYPPARTLLVVLFAFMLLLAVGAEALLVYWPSRRGRSGVLVGLSLLVGLYGGYRLHREGAVLAQLRAQQAVLRPAYVWLRTQHFRRIWVESRDVVLIWQHYALAAGQPRLPLVVDDDAPTSQPGPVGEVEALSTLPTLLPPGLPVLYQGEHLVIIRVSPAQPRLYKP